MIRQVSPVVHFEDARAFTVPLQARSAAHATIVLSVTMVGRACALRVSDNLAAPRWRQANQDALVSRWFRVPGPHGGVQEIIVDGPVALTGTAVAAEFVGLAPGAAVQALCDLITVVA